MDDSDRPLIGLAAFALLLAADFILHGFLAAVDNLNERQTEKKAEEGSRRALWLLQVKSGSVRILPALEFIITAIGVVVGIYQSRMYERFGCMDCAICW